MSCLRTVWIRVEFHVKKKKACLQNSYIGAIMHPFGIWGNLPTFFFNGFRTQVIWFRDRMRWKKKTLKIHLEIRQIKLNFIRSQGPWHWDSALANICEHRALIRTEETEWRTRGFSISLIPLVISCVRSASVCARTCTCVCIHTHSLLNDSPHPPPPPHAAELSSVCLSLWHLPSYSWTPAVSH